MTEPHLQYVGPLPKALTYDGKGAKWKEWPWGFIVVVVVPTLIAAIYFLLIASPVYVSESRFVVRTANGGGNPSSFGVALQGVGLSAGQTDAFAVHEYVRSTNAVADLERTMDLPAVLGPPGTDLFSRYPRPGEYRSDEGVQKALYRFVTVGYDSTTSISTLRVKAFRPQDAQRIALTLLEGGEALVNRLNERSVNDAVAQAKLAQTQAQTRLNQAQSTLTSFRNQERFIDPVRTATESSQLIGGLLETVAQLQAERSQLASEAPSSPALPSLDGRIAAYQRQINAERAKVTGSSGSLAPKIGQYEEMILDRELASEELTQATAVLIAAEQDARRQRLYLERIVAPSLPDQAIEPQRLLSILVVLTSCLLIYGIGWLLWAGVREHRQT
ncbi:chain-length determining protein [Brevundimonas sp. LM2]|uniref:chain-length determining protein n=1 Tax=Brevundimonas sp. LM2 TaxID=1938605 RepID=UPI000983FD4A|nr:chain-length determining protein [Brevundimonas sp. LM2]AQR60889.1 chain-length determining protein [Brevundimonas sp. LM2]